LDSIRKIALYHYRIIRPYRIDRSVHEGRMILHLLDPLD
jgi:hypothetical protein